MKQALMTLLAATTLMAAQAHAGGLYTEDEGYFSQLTAGKAITSDLSGPFVRSGNTWSWSDVAFSCKGAYCDGGFGGYSERYNYLVDHYVYFAGPDTATLTFSQPISSVGMDVWGLGHIQGPTGNIPSTLYVSYADGSQAFFSDYVFHNNVAEHKFFGMVFDKPVTSIGLATDIEGNGIFFNQIRYTVAAVPEPDTWAMLSAGLGLAAFAARRRRAK